MTSFDRLVQLKRQRDLLRGPEFRTSIQARRDILSVIVPLLNFNDYYYSNAVPIADVLGRPAFSSNFYDQAFAQIDSLVNQAINELEHGLTPSQSPPEAVAAAEEKEKSHPIAVALITTLGLVIVALIPITASHCQPSSHPSSATASPSSSPTSTITPAVTPPKNVITVVSIKNGSSIDGEYFDFDPADMDAALESKAWDHQYLWASQTIDGPRRKIWVVRGCSGSPTTLCGRYEPKGKPGGFYQNERLYVFWKPEG